MLQGTATCTGPAAGMFESVYDDGGRMVGAFGVTRSQEPEVQPADTP